MTQLKPEANQPTKRKLPIGIQTFSEIRGDHCYYVDKTAYMGRLVAEGKHYFLSRPRRFGKSLFLDTLKELFEGNEPLFKGLAIHQQWDWSVRHPVLRLDFSNGNFKDPGDLHEDALEQLDALESEIEVRSGYDTARGRFRHLLRTLHQQTLGSEELLSAFDVDHIATEALLFQTGYLTIRRTELRGGETYYRLGYPNREVQQSLNKSLLNYLTGDPARRAEHSARLYDLLLANDFDGLETLFKSFFAGIPYQWHTNSAIVNYEGYYASVFYSYFASLGLAITVEDSSQQGRLDMAVAFNENVYLFEFKVVEQATAGAALGQLQARDYAAKYRGRGEPIYLIGVEFSQETRNVAAFEVERV